MFANVTRYSGILRIYLQILIAYVVLLGTAQGDDRPMIAIIIDDIGYNQYPDSEVVNLPVPVTCAFLPDTPYAKKLAHEASLNGMEIMLHLPMQSMNGQKLGPGGLELDMSERQFKTSLDTSIDSLPNVRGINNHMGSLLTQHPGHMSWLMHELKMNPGMYFIDSRTTSQTVALQVAREYGIPSLKRDIFIDSIPNDEDYARKQLELAYETAQKKGYAIAIGHPFEATINAVREMAASSENKIHFVTVSHLINELDRRQPQWHAYLSPSLKAAKN
jgi:polysaccharide deacetylase 2 family uncharacterized protein YibQ